METQTTAAEPQRRRRTRQKPRYEEVAEDLMRRMEQPADGGDGGPEFPVGSYLPTKRALQAEYSISLATLDNTFDILVAQHRIAPQQGRGTQVTEPDVFVSPGGTDDDRMTDLINQLLTRISALTGIVTDQGKRLAALEGASTATAETDGS